MSSANGCQCVLVPVKFDQYAASSTLLTSSRATRSFLLLLSVGIIGRAARLLLVAGFEPRSLSWPVSNSVLYFRLYASLSLPLNRLSLCVCLNQQDICSDMTQCTNLSMHAHHVVQLHLQAHKLPAVKQTTCVECSMRTPSQVGSANGCYTHTSKLIELQAMLETIQYSLLTCS